MDDAELLEPLEDLTEGCADSPDSCFDGADAEHLALFNQLGFPVAVLDEGWQVLWRSGSFAAFFNGVRQGEHLLSREKVTLLNSDPGQEAGTSGKRAIHTVQLSGEQGKIALAQLQMLPITQFFPSATKLKNAASLCILSDITRSYKPILYHTYQSLLAASRLKDDDTGNHVERVNAYSRFLAKRVAENRPDVDKDFVEDISHLAAMHDVGKIGTPDDILHKPGKLDDREMAIMKEHTVNGAYLLATFPNPMAREIALFHHERWDGKGYPYGLSGSMIPLCARIVAIADVYDALRSKRSYKEAWPHERAISLILENGGSHFDPDLVAIVAAEPDSFRLLYEGLNDA